MIARTNNPFKDLYKSIEEVGKKGFDAVEIESAYQDLSKINVSRVKKILKKYDMKAFAHFPFYLFFSEIKK